MPDRDSKEENLDIPEVKKLIMKMVPDVSIPHPPRFSAYRTRLQRRGRNNDIFSKPGFRADSPAGYVNF